jgi:hypothetical protein
MTQDSTFHEAIHASLKAMHTMLEAADHQIDQACEGISEREQNRAVGAVLGVDVLLNQALDLYKAIIAMHRCKP